MESKVYGSVLKFCQNQDDTFITDKIDSIFHNKGVKPLSSGDASLQKYVNAVSKLFTEINVSEDNLWIFPITGTSSVRIYFSDPFIYPVSLCCQKCIYVDMESSLNGSIICPQCNMNLVSFIHYRDSNDKEGKMNEIYKHKVFKERRKVSQAKNRMLYDNLTSNRFRTKNLKKILQDFEKDTQFNSLINHSTITVEMKSTPQQSRLNSKKDGFILQIKTSHMKTTKPIFALKSNAQCYHSPNQGKQNRQNSIQAQKSNLQHQLSIQETKKIIVDIFRSFN